LPVLLSASLLFVLWVQETNCPENPRKAEAASAVRNERGTNGGFSAARGLGFTHAAALQICTYMDNRTRHESQSIKSNRGEREEGGRIGVIST